MSEPCTTPEPALENKTGSVVTPEMKDLYAKVGLTELLRLWWRRHGRLLKPGNVFAEATKAFGEMLIDPVCVPLGLSAGACIIVAIEIAKEEDTEIVDKKHK